MNKIRIPGLPSPATWLRQPRSCTFSLQDGLRITGDARTDWFIDPGTGIRKLNAPALLFRSTRPCLFQARVGVHPAATYDAGVLVVYVRANAWAKFCLEQSPQRELTVVSVVTRGVSDDCNAFPLEGNSAFLRVARLKRAFAFHISLDGTVWKLIRHFALGSSSVVRMGFLAQSPTGDGCEAVFSGIRYEERLLADLRSGE
jgi:regulation of enolase protein 1 (concanavalin A-like superfamily)